MDNDQSKTRLTRIVSLEAHGANVYWDASGIRCDEPQAVYGGRLGYDVISRITRLSGGRRSFAIVPAVDIEWWTSDLQQPASIQSQKESGSDSRLWSHLNSRFDAVNTRFDNMRDLWRAELRRIEGVLDVIDARLSHLEDKSR